MQFAKNIRELVGKTILDMRMGPYGDLAMFVTTDGTLMMVKYEFREDEDDYEAIGATFYPKGMVTRYLVDHGETRTWLRHLGVMTKEEEENYEDILKARIAKERIERAVQDDLIQRDRLKSLIEKYPDLAKSIVEDLGGTTNE